MFLKISYNDLHPRLYILIICVILWFFNFLTPFKALFYIILFFITWTLINSLKKTCPKYYQTSNLKDLFKNTKPEDVLSFIKETNVLIKIWSNIIKTHTLNLKTHTKDKTNLTLSGIKFPKEIYMPLNKTQTQANLFTVMSVFIAALKNGLHKFILSLYSLKFHRVYWLRNIIWKIYLSNKTWKY